MSPPPPIDPLRIAVLETDQIFPERNGYGGLYTALLHDGADAIGWPRDRLQISAWDVVNARGEGESESVAEYPRLEDVDAVLISGSSECLSASIRARFLPIQRSGFGHGLRWTHESRGARKQNGKNGRGGCFHVPCA